MGEPARKLTPDEFTIQPLREQRGRVIRLPVSRAETEVEAEAWLLDAIMACYCCEMPEGD